MPRHYRRRMKMVYPQKIKNQYNEDASILANTTVEVIFATAVNGQANTKLIGTEVPVGAKVQSMDVYVNAISQTGGTVGSYVYYMAKVKTGQGASFPIPSFSGIGLSKVRNQIFKSEMTLIGTEDAGPLRTKFRQKIPKSMQRIADGDKISLFFICDTAIVSSVGVRYYYKE